MRLLPPNRELGWTPYVWLVYLSFLLVYPFFSGATPRTWAFTLGAVAVFLPLYFRAWWVRGGRIVPFLAAMALLGVVTVPINPGGSVFFIFAASFAGFAGPLRVAVRYVLAISALVAVEAWLLALHPGIWVPGIFFSLVVGLPNAYFAEASRADARLRLAQEEIERLAKTAERERIARDLHDLLGHTLSLITLKAELAARLAERDPARAAAEACEIERISRRALQEVRDAVRGYRAAGLPSELASAHLALEAAGIALEVEGDPGTLPARADAALAMALREAVTNVVRHSGASRCAVRCARDGREIRIEITDDGHGGMAPEGAGLAGMRERIEALGGSVERAGGEPGGPKISGAGGMVLRLRLPLAGDDDSRPALPIRRAG